MNPAMIEPGFQVSAHSTETGKPFYPHGNVTEAVWKLHCKINGSSGNRLETKWKPPGFQVPQNFRCWETMP